MKTMILRKPKYFQNFIYKNKNLILHQIDRLKTYSKIVSRDRHLPRHFTIGKYTGACG